MTRPVLPHGATALCLAALLLAGCNSDSTSDPAPGGQGSSTSTAAETAASTTGAPSDPDAFTPPVAPTGQAGQPRGLDLDADSVDVHDVDQVAQAFAATKLTPDTELDLTPADVDRRAARWMTPEYAEQLTRPRPSRGGADWLTLAEQQGYYSVRLEETAATEQGLITTSPEDLAAERPYIAHLTPHDADLPKQSFAIVVYLTRSDTDAPWGVYDWYQETSYE